MNHAAFDSLGACTLPRGGGTGLRLRHRSSGAEVVAVQNGDPERVFGILFETLPECANGVAHLLEHLVFRGSEQYPQTNLYSSLLQNSALTGLNASTRADCTLYHLSSAEEDDFATLIDVVLDAVFHPLIRASDFAEEQQVVMNEMTGHHAVPTTTALEGLRHALLPGSVYGIDHGGVPEMIAQLRHADLRAFHAKHYQPGRARVFLWGDFDLAARLDQLDRSLGSNTGAVAFDLGMPGPFDRPRMLSARGPAATCAPEITAFGWAFAAECPDLWRAVSLGLLAEADGPLRRALETRGGRVIGAGFSKHTPLGTFEIALMGHPQMEQAALLGVIEDTLGTIARTWPGEGWTTRVADRFEFTLRSLGAQRMGSTGLRVLNMIRDEWRHSADPLALLDIDARVARLREIISADPQAMARLIRADLLDNPHQVTLSLQPQTQPQSQPASPAPPSRPAPDPRVVGAISAVPFIAPHGPPPRVRTIAVETEDHLLHLTGQPPGLSRAELAISLSGLTAAQIDMVPVLAMLLVDQKGEDGIDISARCWAATQRRNAAKAFLSLAGTSLPAQGARLPERLCGALRSPLPPPDSVWKRITAERAKTEAQVAALGHVFCETRLRASGIGAGALNERLVGLHRLETLRRCLTHTPQEVWDQLDSVQRTLAETGTMTLAVSGIAPDDAKPVMLNQPTGAHPRALPLALDVAQREEIETGSPNFSTGQAVMLEDAGAAHVAAHMLETGWLWDALRVAGGAYSVRCSYCSDDHLLSMLSVRDPDPERTLEHIAKGPIWLRAAAQSDLLARCVSAKVGHLRRPIRPDDAVATALQRHLCDQTDAQRQQELERVFHVDAKAMTACADALEQTLRTARTVVMG